MIIQNLKLTENASYILNNKIYDLNNNCLLNLEEPIPVLRKDLKYPLIKKDEYTYEIIRFIELKGKSDYSIGDSIASIKKIANKVEVGCGLADHGQGYGLFNFNQEMLKQNKKPILGCEFYVNKNYDHLTLLAKNKNGYQDLIRLISLGNSRLTKEDLDDKLARPYLEIEDLENVNVENFVVLHGYDNSYINRAIENKDIISAEKYLETLISIFKKDDFYLEIQYVNEYSEDINDELYNLADKFNIKTVLTSDYHQIDKEDSFALEVFQAIGNKEQVGDNNWKLVGDNYYIHTSNEIEKRNLDSQLLDNTIEIFNKIESYDLYQKENFLPIFNIPKEFNGENEYFDYLVEKGIRVRLGEQIPDNYRERLELEKQTIKDMGFVGYFLIVADFINYAKRNYAYTDKETEQRWKNFLNKTNYPKAPIAIGPSRGSAGGSLVSYAMAITEVDPLKFGLLFERFLNPERVSMPDIDTDIPDNKRQEVIHYVKDLYNDSDLKIDSKVSGIGIFGTYKIKNLIKSIVRALYKDVSFGEKLTKFITDPEMSVDEYFELQEFLDIEEQDKRVIKIKNVASKLYLLISNLSQHAAAYVIAPKPTTDFLPTTFVYNSKSKEIEQMTAYTYVEAVGLLKMDFLGLRTMTIIQDTIDDINSTFNKELTIDKILDKAITDIEVFKHLQSGNTEDCFQLGSSGMTEVITQSLTDIYSEKGLEQAQNGDYFSRLIASISMYRPGPLAYIPDFIHNALHPEYIEYDFPELEHILKNSYGLLIYQESIMQILREVAGFSLGQADIARRAISKKKIDDLRKLKSSFIYGDDAIIGGIKKLGLSEKILEKLWNDIESFASYGFNKSHAAGYAHISIITAFLGRYYPLQFAVANLNNPSGNQDGAIGELLSIYKKRNINISPANLNISDSKFKVYDNSILFGLEGIKGLASYSQSIYDERKNGDFIDYQNFISRMARNTNTSITKGVLKSLIYSGVLDIFPGTRKDKIESLDKVSKVIALLKKEQDTIFDKEEDIFNKFLDYKDSEFSNLEILLKEKEYTGYFISGHPVDKYNDLKNKLNNYNEIINIKDLVDGTDVDIIGIINKTRKILTRHGDLMSFANLSDVSGDIDTVIFPNTFSIFNRYLKESKIIVISGKVDKGKIIVQTIRNPEDITISTKIDHIQLDLSSFNNIKAKENLEQCILETTNLTPESIKMSYIFNETEYFGTKKYGYLYVDFNNVNIKKIKEIIGKENLKIIWKTDISI